MTRYVVDTNVPIVANGRPTDDGIPSIKCRIAAISFLHEILESGKIIVDLEGAVQIEYRRHLNACGQPGVGDRFYQEVLHSAPRLIDRVDLPLRDDGEYADFPQPLIDVNFDPSDRKFAALARRERASVVNAVDSDWLEHRVLLANNGIEVQFVCGCDPDSWFVD